LGAPLILALLDAARGGAAALYAMSLLVDSALPIWIRDWDVLAVGVMSACSPPGVGPC
jgi:hypothetical protein